MLEAKFAEAIALAANAHKAQLRKDRATPYICHPLQVAEYVKRFGGDLKCQIVAILHDTLEDTSVTEDDIRYFGEDVLEAVKLLTRHGNDEEAYVTAILGNHMAATVKNADKICNMLDVIALFNSRQDTDASITAMSRFLDEKNGITHKVDTEGLKHFFDVRGLTYDPSKHVDPAANIKLNDEQKFIVNYIWKAQKYYKGKFSSFLDEIIGFSAYFTLDSAALIKFATKSYQPGVAKLYSDIAAEQYAEAKTYYATNTDLPDFSRTDIRFVYDAWANQYYCAYGRKWYEDVFYLTRGGWKRHFNAWFYDFVDTSKL